MSPEKNKDLVQRYVDAINGKPKNEQSLRPFVDDPALVEHVAVAEAAFPSYRFEPRDVIAEDDKVVVRFKVRGTHKGEFFGVAPTGRTINLDGIIIYRIAGDKIAEHWLQMDVPSLMQQLTADAPADAVA
jgi:predicted ester cyclase